LILTTRWLDRRFLFTNLWCHRHSGEVDTGSGLPSTLSKIS